MLCVSVCPGFHDKTPQYNNRTLRDPVDPSTSSSAQPETAQQSQAISGLWLEMSYGSYDVHGYGYTRFLNKNCSVYT